MGDTTNNDFYRTEFYFILTCAHNVCYFSDVKNKIERAVNIGIIFGK